MRADLYLVSRGAAESRTKAQEMIGKGAVRIGGRVVTKAAEQVEDSALPGIEVCGEVLPYVSRGGLKLEGALRAFSLSVSGLCAADLGASTGGFTDCLLQNGAAKVFAVDSGTMQLHPKLREDPRVVVMENRNARYLTAEDFGGEVDLCVCDLSFISQTKVFGAVEAILKDGGVFVSLIKPQFEVGRAHLNHRGIVTDERARKNAVETVKTAALAFHLHCLGVTDSPIEGGDGNREYLALFRKEENA